MFISYIEMDSLKRPKIREKGAIHPCHIPEKKPAGSAGLYDPPPGKQDVNKKDIKIIKQVNLIFFITGLFIG